MPDNRQPVEIPAGKMQVWDPKQKQIILVDAPTTGPDRVTLTLRLHDAAEKKDKNKSASWATIQIDRADLIMPAADFLAKYVAPHLSKLSQLKLT